ncbi:MAG: histidine phosphatase family protein [Thiobacillus sp.]|nr:histidine phosphatase family protein [Thiobacillus sp.]
MPHVAKPVTTRICFIRHGETDWNVARRIQGHTDIPLNETGRAQALAMAFNAAHQHFRAIYSSDLLRTMETAQVLAQREDQDVKPLAQLRERHYGVFQGITAAEGAERYPQAYAHYVARDLDYDFETGESLRALAERVSKGIDWLVRHHSGQTIAAVSHSGVLDVIYRRATGRSLHTPRDFVIPNCALNWFHFDGHGWHLESWADRHYLHDVLTESPE